MAGPKMKSELCVADSNVLLRLLLGDVPEQSSKIVSWLGRQSEGTVIVADAVLVEVLFLLESKRAYGIPRVDFMSQVTKLLRNSQWRVTALTWQALRHFASTKLDYVDCLLLAMQTKGIVTDVASFDKKLVSKLDRSLF